MVVGLAKGDTAETLLLLSARPLYNVFLEYLVRAGALGRSPGFMGWWADERLQAVMLIGPLGGTSLEVMNPGAYAPLAEAAWEFPIRPRHIVGPEEITAPFWEAYSRFGVRPRWERREPFFMVTPRDLKPAPAASIEPAGARDLDEIIENSALQHREDLKEDPFGRDPDGFRKRHRTDIREQRWWILREGRRIAFQVHLGPENERAVQLGGVMTPPDLRQRGYGTRGLTAIAQRLFGHRPGVSLFCDEANEPAIRLYRKIGFQQLFYYRSWLLDDESAGG